MDAHPATEPALTKQALCDFTLATTHVGDWYINKMGILTAHAGIAFAEAWHGLVEQVGFGGAGGDVIEDEMLLLVAPEIEEPLLGDEDDAGDEEDNGEDAGEEVTLARDVVVAATPEHGVVGCAVTQAHRELAAPKTAPIDAPQLVMTQFWAAD